jgi:hypothetical protein
MPKYDDFWAMTDALFETAERENLHILPLHVPTTPDVGYIADLPHCARQDRHYWWVNYRDLKGVPEDPRFPEVEKKLKRLLCVE